MAYPCLASIGDSLSHKINLNFISFWHCGKELLKLDELLLICKVPIIITEVVLEVVVVIEII